MVESIRAKAEELRTRAQARVKEIRGGGSSSEHSPLLGNLGIMKGPLATEFKEKGVVATVRARVEKLRASPTGSTETSSPSSPSPDVYAKPRVRTYTAKIKTY